MWIYRAYVTDKNGQRRYAKWYGKRAFRIWVDDEKNKTEE